MKDDSEKVEITGGFQSVDTLILNAILNDFIHRF